MHKFSVVSLIGLLAYGASLLEAAEVDLLKTLESFAKDPLSKSTGLTYEDYLNFYREARKNSSGKVKDESRKLVPSYRLLEDFELKPMKRWRLSPNDGDAMKQAYVNRMEQTFKRFWPSYVDGQFSNSREMFNAKKLMRFIRLVFNSSAPEKPTLEMWRQAKREYHILKAKAEEVVNNEDIYARLIDHEHMLNLFNHPQVKNIIEFSDRFDKCETDEKLKEMVDDFRNKHVYGIAG